MSSPKDQLLQALQTWIEDDAREHVARARGDHGADPPARVAARHAALRGPRGRELFEEARERGMLEEDELRAAASWLRESYAAIGRTRAEDRLGAALGARVPHDSDHHAPLALFERMTLEPHAGRRRAIARSLEAFAPTLLRALLDGLADVDESLEAAAWLRDVPPPIDRASEPALLEAAELTLRATDDAYAEALDRAAHAGTEIERWADLALVLRGARFDPIADRARRWRRLADRFAALGVRDALSKRARVETTTVALTTGVVALAVPSDVRVLPSTIERGLASERAGAIAIGRAVAIAWTHPALPAITARPDEGSIGRALGALLAHVAADPRAAEMDEKSARALREHALLLELFELRTEAAAAIARRSVYAHDFGDAAREALRGAWRADVDANVAACAALRPARHPLAAYRALRWAAPLHVALRERYDEDWWKNPRAGEPLRAACERGAALTIEAWADELGAVAGDTARYAELLG